MMKEIINQINKNKLTLELNLSWMVLKNLTAQDPPTLCGTQSASSLHPPLMTQPNTPTPASTPHATGISLYSSQMTHIHLKC